MPHTTNSLNERSVLQITLWPGSSQMREGVVSAFAALGDDAQRADLILLGRDFVDFLDFKTDSFANRNYPTLVGFRYSSSYLDESTVDGRIELKRAPRVVTKKKRRYSRSRLRRCRRCRGSDARVYSAFE